MTNLPETEIWLRLTQRGGFDVPAFCSFQMVFSRQETLFPDFQNVTTILFHAEHRQQTEPDEKKGGQFVTATIHC